MWAQIPCQVSHVPSVVLITTVVSDATMTFMPYDKPVMGLLLVNGQVVEPIDD